MLPAIAPPFAGLMRSLGVVRVPAAGYVSRQRVLGLAAQTVEADDNKIDGRFTRGTMPSLSPPLPAGSS
jgi:hypothetical protein